MEKYDFANASTYLYNFVYDDFTSCYVELSKIKLNSTDKLVKDNTIAVLLKVLKSIILMIYPYTPFIAEEIYLNLPGHKESIMLDSYPEVDKTLIYEDSEKKIKDLIDMIKDVRAYKVENNLAPNAKVKLTLIPTSDVDLTDYLVYLKRFTFAEDIKISNNNQGNIKIYQFVNMLIEEDIDKDTLLKKFDEEIERLTKEVERSEKMLSNPNFISKAPEEKIKLEREKYQKYQSELNLFIEKKNNLK